MRPINCQTYITLHYITFDDPARELPVSTSPRRFEKLEWCGYPMVKIFLQRCFFRFDRIYTYVTDRQTDAHDGIDRACIASRGKNVYKLEYRP